MIDLTTYHGQVKTFALDVEARQDVCTPFNWFGVDD